MSPIPDDPNQAQAWISGEAPDQTIDFYIPRGNRGPIGPQGPMGPSLLVGTVETATGPAVPGTIGPQGLKGDKGDPGGFTVGTPLGTSDLNNIYTGGHYRQDNGNNASAALNYPVNNGGLLTVVERVTGGAATGSVEQIYSPLTAPASTAPNMVFRRWYNTGVWGSWVGFGRTRTDQTAGRAMYIWDQLNNRDQLIYGDTGERDITSMLNGTAAAFKIRRNGSMVTFWGVGVMPSANGTANFLNTTLPVGFRNPNTASVSAYTGLTPKASWLSANGSGLAIDGTNNLAANQYNFMIVYPTVDAWPATLPGVASGTIPNT